MVARADVRHLLQRTEVVARRDRVAELEALPTLEAAVDDILDVEGARPTVTFRETETWQQGVEYQRFWLDQLAHDNPRPCSDWIAFFWHGHFVSSLGKTRTAAAIRDQIDLYRADGLGRVDDLAIAMSTQPAMLRYLDNNTNKRASPNQNFGRELIELFLLGVGNYTEADIEASSAAWTGHTDRQDPDGYVWQPDWHDSSPKRFLGRTINSGGDPRLHGAETIDVIFGNGIVPANAPNVANRGRPTREVAAEHLTRNLWTFFAGTDCPAAVVTDLRDVAVANGFELRAWVRALLLRPEFYTTEVRQGLVRSPVAYMVALMHALQLRADGGYPHWLMDAMGQRMLYPPNVSGWRHNSAFIGASPAIARMYAARWMVWQAMPGYWDGSGGIRLAYDTITKAETDATSQWQDDPAVNATRRKAMADRMIAGVGADLTPTTVAAIRSFAEHSQPWELDRIVPMILMAPEMNLA